MRGMVRTFGVGLAVALLSIARAGAEQPKPVVAAEVSLASIDAVDASMKRGGFDGYAGLMTAFFENFPVMGKGALDTGAPLGMYFLVGDDLEPHRMGMFLLPVTAHAAQLKALREQGWKDLTGHSDTVIAPNEFAIRRTATHMVFGGNSQAVAIAAVDKLAVPYKESGALGHAHVSVAAIRTASPRRFAAFLDQMGRDHAGKPPAEAFGGQLVDHWIGTSLDTVDFTLLGNAEHLTFRCRLAPFELKPVATKFARATFPDGCFGRADTVYPAAQTIPFITRFIVATHYATHKDAEQSRVIDRELPVALKPLIGDAVSFGFEWDNGALVTYASTEFAEVPDVRSTLKNLSERFGDVLKTSTYTDRDLTITRVTAIDDGKTVLYADFVPDGKRLTVAFCSRDGKYVARAARLKPAGEVSGLLSGEIDLPAVRKLVAVLPADAIDAGQKAVAAEILKGDKVTFTVANDGQAMEFNLTGPISWLGSVMKMAPLQ